MGSAEEGQERILAGRYRLGSVIGQGGMGVVWRARDQLLNRDVAVKEIVWPPQLSDADREVARRRAVLEAQIAGRLSHPNVVGIYDILTEDDRPWIVMELVPYPSLRDIVRDDGPLAPVEAARVGLGILAALGAAHGAGILHRDVKPANVLVGPDGRVVLTDFGIARAADATAVTATGAIVGSPPYISPERARGEQAGPPGDMWGLGVTLYAAVEGRRPFDRDDPISTLTAVVSEEPEPATHAGPLGPVIAGLLRKDPGERLDALGATGMLRSAVGPPGLAPEPVELPPEPAEPAPAEPAPDPVTLVSDSPGLAPEPPGLALEPALRPPGPAALASEPAVLPPEPAAPEPRSAEPEPEPVLPPPGPVFSPRPMPPPGPPPGPATGSGGGGRRRPWPSVVIAVAVAVVAIGVAIGAGVLLAGGSPPGHGTSASGSHPSAHSSARPSSSPHPAASHTAASHPAASPPPAKRHFPAQAGALPAGFYRYTDATGFSIGVPNGWRVSHQGHYVYLTDPANAGIFLLIDQSDQPKPDPLADWRQQQANREGTYPDYRLIRLTAVHYSQAEKAADWEFTYSHGGVPTRVLNRNVLANAHHAYALYWTTPASDWTASYHYFQSFAATFRPAS